MAEGKVIRIDKEYFANDPSGSVEQLIHAEAARLDAYLRSVPDAYGAYAPNRADGSPGEGRLLTPAERILEINGLTRVTAEVIDVARESLVIGQL